MLIHKIDDKLIRFFRKISLPLARTGIFVVFFWFGILKVVGQSPASELVEHLFSRTVPFMSFHTFMILFGLFEALIGILFLIKGAERLSIALLAIHMVTTFLPLVMLRQETWSGFFVPTLEGQYIIKNLLIISAAVVIAAQLEPMHVESR